MGVKRTGHASGLGLFFFHGGEEQKQCKVGNSGRWTVMLLII